LLVASLKPISSSGLPCAACVLLGSADGVLPLLNQLEAMVVRLSAAQSYNYSKGLLLLCAVLRGNNSPCDVIWLNALLKVT
jgi:hypothetical protein